MVGVPPLVPPHEQACPGAATANATAARSADRCPGPGGRAGTIGSLQGRRAVPSEHRPPLGADVLSALERMGG